MPERNDEERGLLDAYTQATTRSPSEVEHALARTLARIASAERPANLVNGRRRWAWAIAAGFATLVIAGGALAGVRWLRARPQSDAQPYGAARLDRVDGATTVEAGETNPVRTIVVPTSEVPEPEPTSDAPQLAEAPEPLEPPPVRERHRDRPPPKAPEPVVVEEVPDDTQNQTESMLTEESRLLARARRALSDDDFEGALEWVEEHERRHPDGALTEERLILEAVAACRGGLRERGLAAAEQLRQLFPQTPALAKVEQSCSGD